MSVPDLLAKLTGDQLDDLRQAADADEHAAPEVKRRLGEHLDQETERRAGGN